MKKLNHIHKVSNIKSFINKYNRKGINYPTKMDDWKIFEKNNPVLIFNILYVKFNILYALNILYINEKEIYPAYISKINSKLMISNNEK